jgi:hypothetical protein
MAVKGNRNRKVETVEAQQVLESVKNLDAGSVVSEVNNLQVSLQEKLAGISASITNKLAQIDTIDTAIRLKEQRLKELYGVEAEAIKWDDIQAQHEAEKADWAVQEHARSLRWSEEQEANNKERQRQEEEWEYEFEQKKQRTEDNWKVAVLETEREEKRRKAELERSWTERDLALRKQEAEVAELRKKVESIDALVGAEKTKAEKIVTNVLTKQFEHEKALLQKDIEAAKTLCAAQLDSKTDTIEDLQQQIMDLKAQLSVARQDAKEVATSALNATSERKVAEALKQVVDGRDQQPSGKGK